MKTVYVITNIYDRDLRCGEATNGSPWTLPEGMVVLSVRHEVGGEDLDRDEVLSVITYGTAAEACAAWGVNFVAANDTPNMDTAPLFQSRPRYIDRDWMVREAREVAALEA